MWDRDYQDYKRDQPLIKQRIDTGRGFTGCEMHELNGWGNTFQHPINKNKRVEKLKSLISLICGLIRKKSPSKVKKS